MILCFSAVRLSGKCFFAKKNDMRVKDKRSLYMDEVFGFEDPLLRLLGKKAEEEGVSFMQLSPHEGRILYFLARLLKAEKAVEIGSLYSYSTVYLARALPESGTVWTLDLSEKRQRAAARILEAHDKSLRRKIQYIPGDGRKTLRALEPHGPFDMVFIDADKNSYGFYLKWAEKHLRAGGLLAADNTFLFGAVYGGGNNEAGAAPAPQAPGLSNPKPPPSALPGRHSLETAEIMRAFNRRLAKSNLWSGALFPTAEGLTVAVKTG